MPILLFVSTMIIMMSILTYARFDHFMHSLKLHQAYRDYIENEERGFINKKAKALYEAHHIVKTESAANENEGDEDEDEYFDEETLLKSEKENFHEELSASGSNRLSPRLNIYPLIAVEDKGYAPLVIALLEEIITEIFQDCEFYKKAIEEKPDFFKQLFEILRERALDEKFCETMGDKQELANLDLYNLQFQEALYKLFKGTTRARLSHQPEKVSLLDEITLDRAEKKISVYLASPVMLQALFGGKEIVFAILEKRQELYSKVKAKDYTISQAASEFEREFKDKCREAYRFFVTFDVSRSRPSH